MPTLATNKKAYYKYEIDNKIEAGIELTGSEVKSIRSGRMQLTDSFARFNKGLELFLLNAHIAQYDRDTSKDYDPYRPRKLLLHKVQLTSLYSATKGKGLTIVPLKVYTSANGKIKISIGLAKGKKKHDKRRREKEKDIRKEINQSLTARSKRDEREKRSHNKA